MTADLLPLFPLDVVLFPGMPLPLHIFEPRSKLMTRRCLDKQQEFGVLLARRGALAQVGCTAEILKVVKEYDDGRLDILTIGQSRFRLGEMFDDQPYLQGRVEFLPDEEEPPGEAPDATRLLELYAQVSHLLHGRRQPAPLAEGGFSLAFQLARDLPLELETKQGLLELLSESERQHTLAERLQAWLPELTRLRKVRDKAGGNGHGR